MPDGCFCGLNPQVEESKLTAQIASLQNLDTGSPAASDGGQLEEG